eukprot:7380103-Prymnesium_polylepis.1
MGRAKPYKGRSRPYKGGQVEQHAHLAREQHAVVRRHVVARRPQPVTVEARADVTAVGEGHLPDWGRGVCHIRDKGGVCHRRRGLLETLEGGAGPLVNAGGGSSDDGAARAPSRGRPTAP